ncbi:MAG: Ig-like domain-containing protein [Fimbriimonadales bacterium]
MFRVVTGLMLFALVACAFASGSIQLSAYPLLSVADGRSTVTITALVRNSSGTTVSDGTIVRFSTNAGSFREADVRTVNGTARAVLVAPDRPQIVTVTASATGVNVVNSYDIEFVRDRSMLNTARQYAEITGPDYLVYHSEIKTVSATGANRTAKVSYRDIKIAASDMQVNLSSLNVVATDAVLTIGDKSVDCKRLKYQLSQRRGSAIATIDGKLAYVKIAAAEPKVEPAGMTPTEFDFADVGLSQTSIHSDRIVAFPNRELQFHHARMYVGDMKVMNFPMYSLKPNSDSPLFSDQLLSFQNGGVVLNYPHYLTLSPSFTSVVRLKSGQDYSRGGSTSQGIYLEWDNHYMMGEKAEGNFGLTNIGRDDMGLSWRHTQRIDYDTNANAYLDMPGFKSLYGNVGLTRDFKGYTAQLTATSARSLTGVDSESQRVDFNVDTDTKRLGKMPLTYSLGLTATSASAMYGSSKSSQEGVGIRNRLLLTPQPLWEGANFTASLTTTNLWGDSSSSGLKLLGNATVATPLGRAASLRLSYDYAQDKFTSDLLGRHRVSGELSFDSGPFGLTVFSSKALDIDSFQLFLDGSWEISGLWRFGSSLTWDQYLGSSVSDHLVWLGYRLGTREIALTYSPSTQRFGFQLGNVARR